MSPYPSGARPGLMSAVGAGIRRVFSFLFQLSFAAAVLVGVGFILTIIHITSPLAVAQARANNRMPVVTEPARPEASFDVERRYAGVIEAARAADIGFEVSGRVVEVSIDIGSDVKRGDVLGRLDVVRLSASVSELEARLSEAEANRLQAQQEFDRQRALDAENATSEARVQSARAALASAAASVASLEAQIRSARADLNDAVLRAPFDGVVTARTFDVGDVVQAGAAAIRLVQSSSREARVAMPIDVASELKTGDPARLVWRGRTYEASVKSVVPEVDAASRSATVVVALPAEATPAIGETVTLLLRQTIQQSGYWVPVASLVADLKGLFAVQIASVTDEGAFRIARAPVQVLYTDGERAFVSGTLQAGDEVVVQGTNRVSPGQYVVLSRLGGEAAQ
ncbi:MAG: efflux RND transporter periplasmic adaptor subunit [Alphaproteobacteria bacterium]|nr:efflux RND transporter periplasmic adaptor subunit [Alphaproteobacteria bacterium]